MNFCNFAKVILARTTRDSNAFAWWEKRNNENNNENSKIVSKYNKGTTSSFRHKFYNNIMHRYPKMHISVSVFQKRIKNLQKYVVESKYFKGNNKNGEKTKFVNSFSLQNWEQLSHRAKMTHTLENCKPCMYENDASALHVSYGLARQEALSKCTEMTEKLLEASNQPKTLKGSINAAKTLISTIKPVFEEKTGHNFTNVFAQSLNLTPKLTHEEKRKQIEENVKKSHEKTQNSQEEDDNDVQYFLASGKSYNQHERDRFAAGFLPYDQCAEAVKARIQKEQDKKVKPKSHHGPFKSYTINHEEVVSEISKIPKSRPINWTRLSKKLKISIHGKTPANAGQVLKQYSLSKGIVAKSEKDYLRRVRRQKKKISHKISVPTQRSAQVFKSIIKNQIQTKKIYIGEEIAPKPYKTNFINQEGELTEKITQIHGRKIPLSKIVENETSRLQRAGVVRDTDFDQMSKDSIKDFCAKIHVNEISHITSTENLREQLKKMENSWKMKMWHDHSDILNHSYVSFMTCFLYDPMNFITDQEFKTRYPERKPVNIQSLVERPQLYIFGLSGNP